MRTTSAPMEIPILLLNKGETAVFQIPILLKALFVSGNSVKLLLCSPSGLY
jgi:hypothetical protein